MAPLNTGFWVGGKRGVAFVVCSSKRKPKDDRERDTGKWTKSFGLRDRRASKIVQLERKPTDDRERETGEQTISFVLRDRRANKIIWVERQASEQNHSGWKTGKRTKSFGLRDRQAKFSCIRLSLNRNFEAYFLLNHWTCWNWEFNYWQILIRPTVTEITSRGSF
jgi:hypothetical protein